MVYGDEEFENRSKRSNISEMGANNYKRASSCSAKSLKIFASLHKTVDYIFRDNIRENQVLNRSNGKLGECCDDLKDQILSQGNDSKKGRGRNLSEQFD